MAYKSGTKKYITMDEFLIFFGGFVTGMIFAFMICLFARVNYDDDDYDDDMPVVMATEASVNSDMTVYEYDIA